jgi:hypothetical protein
MATAMSAETLHNSQHSSPLNSESWNYALNKNLEDLKTGIICLSSKDRNQTRDLSFAYSLWIVTCAKAVTTHFSTVTTNLLKVGVKPTSEVQAPQAPDSVVYRVRHRRVLLETHFHRRLQFIVCRHLRKPRQFRIAVIRLDIRICLLM